MKFTRNDLGGIEAIQVIDNGEGISPNQANESFKEYGDTWKAKLTHTSGNLRILHGKKGEGRLYALALGESFMWDAVATVNGRNVRTAIRSNRTTPTRWRIEDPLETEDPPGCAVTINAPQGKRYKSLESLDAPTNLSAKLAFYLRAYPDVTVVYNGEVLRPDDLIQELVDVPLDLPSEYANDSRPPVLTIVEWNARISDQKMLVCNAEGVALAEHGEEWSDPLLRACLRSHGRSGSGPSAPGWQGGGRRRYLRFVTSSPTTPPGGMRGVASRPGLLKHALSITPYLRWHEFSNFTVEDLHMLPMRHAGLLYAAAQAVRKHLTKRHSEISSQVVGQLKAEGMYPYDPADTNPARVVERQTFDLVVTVARSALPPKGPQRKLSVKLIQSALERNPTDLHDVLEQALSLTDDEKAHLARLLKRTPLSGVISAMNTVVERLNFVGGLRKIFADPQIRAEFREVDQLHPMIAQNLWLFGEEWTLARTEVGLTSVLEHHLTTLGEDIVLEGKLDAVRRSDGRAGRVDILLHRGVGDERRNERLIVELKRPSLRVGDKELHQIKSYARAIVDDPAFRGTRCTWQFLLVTHDIDPAIRRDIDQKGKPYGLADDQDEYQVWVKPWGVLFDDAERKLSFFRKQLDYEATEERVTEDLRDMYDQFIPDALRSVPVLARPDLVE